MNTARLNTAQVLAAGVTLRPNPNPNIPHDRFHFDCSPCQESEMVAAMERGDLLKCAEYYGIAYAWKDGDVYRGTLLQYREITEAPAFESASLCAKWMYSMIPQISG